MPRINKHIKQEEIEQYVSAAGALLHFNRPKNVFYVYAEGDFETWAWVINPTTQLRVKTLRELNKEEWYIALDDAIRRLKESP